LQDLKFVCKNKECEGQTGNMEAHLAGYVKPVIFGYHRKKEDNFEILANKNAGWLK